MRAHEGVTRSMWYEGVAVPQRGGLGADRAFDVCVVGAGIAGLTTAYLLAKEGKRVVVLDERAIGSGQTGRTSAHLASASDDRFAELERSHGENGARLFYESHAAAIDRIESIVADENIHCDFARIPGFLLAASEEHRDMLERELEAALKTGIDATWLERIEIGGRVRGPCIRYRRQARLHPMRYLVALAEAAERAGATICEGVRVCKVTARDDAGPPRVELASGQPAVLADAIVVATNTPGPLEDWAAVYLQQAAYRSYVIGLHVPTRSVDDALLWDTVDPYHYVRVVAGEDGRDVLVVGGEDHRVGQKHDDFDPFAAIEAWARDMYPVAQHVA